jgi:Fe2+ transport system protein FeoA
VTLADVTRGQTVRILAIDSDEVRSQALRLGLGVGATALCQAIIPSGPIVLARSRQEIAIGRQLARAIHVTVV